MFPFSSNSVLIHTQLSEKEFKSRIGIGADGGEKEKRSGWVLYETRKENTIVLEYKQEFYRNAFRPVVICSWCNDVDTIIIQAYLRLPFLSIFMCFTPFIFGLYISYEIVSILPLITTFLLSFCLISIFGYIFFRIDKNWILEEFRKLVSK